MMLSLGFHHCPRHLLRPISPANCKPVTEKVECYMFSGTSIDMDLEFLDRMSQISRRVRNILEESENIKELLAKKIARKAQKAVEAAEVAEEIQADVEEEDEEDDEDEQEEDDDGDDDEDDDEDDDDDDEDDEDEDHEEDEEEPEVQDNELSACWTCFCGRRRNP